MASASLVRDDRIIDKAVCKGVNVLRPPKDAPCETLDCAEEARFTLDGRSVCRWHAEQVLGLYPGRIR